MVEKEDKKFEGKDKEYELETLLFENPEIFPVNKISDDADTWIPLARQVHIDTHRILDVLATDNAGNLYVVECKIKGNQDMKSIRGQITDYVAGLWSKRGAWEEFQTLVKKYSPNTKSLDEILDEEMDDKKGIPDAKERIKQNFENGEYFLVYVVDQITPLLRQVIEWHNKKIDKANKYPTFSLELKRYPSEDGKSLFIVTQNYPYNFDEIKMKSIGESRNLNAEADWDKFFSSTNIESDKKNKIIDFKEKLMNMVEDDEGEIDYGTGKIMPVIMPKFSDTDKRSPIKLKADGGLNLQFHLLEGEYRDEADEFKKELSKIDVLGRLIEKSKSKKTVPMEIDEWLPYKDEILQILTKVFVHHDDQ